MATQLSYLEPQQTLHVRFLDHYVSKSFKNDVLSPSFVKKLESNNLLECNSFICSTIPNRWTILSGAQWG